MAGIADFLCMGAFALFILIGLAIAALRFRKYMGFGGVHKARARALIDAAASKGWKSDGETIWAERNGLKLAYRQVFTPTFASPGNHYFACEAPFGLSKALIVRNDAVRETKVDAGPGAQGALDAIMKSDADAAFFSKYYIMIMANNYIASRRMAAVKGAAAGGTWFSAISGVDKKMDFGASYTFSMEKNVVPIVTDANAKTLGEDYSKRISELVERGFSLMEKVAKAAEAK